jgi:hypothetical protein
VCVFEDFYFGWMDNKGRKEVRKKAEVGKCQRRVLFEITFCLLYNQIADREGNTPFKAFENQPACRSCCRECCGIKHTVIEKNSPLRFR